MPDNKPYKLKQSGTSLLESSIVLMLSASVVVGGILSYLHVGENGLQLQDLSGQIIQMVSEINGLYVNNKKSEKTGIYAGLDNKVVLDLLPHVKKSTINVAGAPFVNTSFPNFALDVNAVYFDKVRKVVVNQGLPSNYFTISALATDNMEMQEFCLRFLSLNYGGQVEGYGIAYQDSTSSYQFKEFVTASESFSQRIGLCQYFRSDKARLSIIFK